MNELSSKVITIKDKYNQLLQILGKLTQIHKPKYYLAISRFVYISLVRFACRKSFFVIFSLVILMQD